MRPPIRSSSSSRASGTTASSAARVSGEAGTAAKSWRGRDVRVTPRSAQRSGRACARRSTHQRVPDPGAGAGTRSRATGAPTAIIVHSLSAAMLESASDLSQGLAAKKNGGLFFLTWSTFFLSRSSWVPGYSRWRSGQGSEQRGAMFNALLDTMLPNSMYWSSISGVVGECRPGLG